MRAIIKWSFNGDAGSSLRNRIVGQLKKKGFKVEPGGNATSTAQAHHISEEKLGDSLKVFWEEASKKPNVKVDHFWVYSDQWSFPDNIDEQIAELGVVEANDDDDDSSSEAE